MLTMRELEPVEADDDRGPARDRSPTARGRRATAPSPPTSRTPSTFFPMLGEYEVWQLINLTGDTHPIHLHLDPFQIVSRRAISYEIPDGRHRGPAPHRHGQTRARPRR